MDAPVKGTTSHGMRKTHPRLYAMFMLAATTGFTIPAFAEKQQVPWECSNYTGDAQMRCLNGFIEQQQIQIRKLEGQLQAQRETMGQLRGQVDQQAAAAANLQQQLAQRPTTTVFQSPYAYSYAYPPVGLGLGIYLGRPWIYSPSFYGYGYGRPFWGLRYYGHRGRHR